MADDDTLSPGDVAALELLAEGFDASAAASDAPCPGENELASFLDGPALGEQGASVEAHVAACPSCRRLVASISSVGGR